MPRFRKIFHRKYKSQGEIIRSIRMKKKKRSKLEKIISSYYVMSLSISNILVANSKNEISDSEAVEEIRKIKVYYQL
jgi:type IV pilus biogenesis protein CpaD/CtpE